MKIVSVKSSQGSLGKNLGTELAPDKILEGINNTDSKVRNDNIIEANKVLENIEGDFFIGGDHSITYALFKGFNKKYKNAGLMVFDAHADCVNNFSPPSHEDFVRVLIEEKILKPENLLLIGLRNIDPIEEKFLKSKKIKYIEMKNINKDLINITEMFTKTLDAFYLSIDIDILDSSEAPGTGYPEKEGFKLKELLDIISKIKRYKNLKRTDLVEVNPLKDIDNKTVDAAKEIVKLLINKI